MSDPERMNPPQDLPLRAEAGQVDPPLESPLEAGAGQVDSPLESPLEAEAGQVDSSLESPLEAEAGQVDSSLESPLEVGAEEDSPLESPLWEEAERMSPPMDLPLGAEGGQVDSPLGALAPGTYRYCSPDDGEQDCKLDFAHDVITEVFPWITGREAANPPTIPPVDQEYKLTTRHKMYIQEFLAKEAEKLTKFIVNIRNEKEVDYDEENYTETRDRIVKLYKDKVYTEMGFIRLCVAVAFATMSNQSADKPLLVDEAGNELHSFICSVLKPGGNIQNSEWAVEVTEERNEDENLGDGGF